MKMKQKILMVLLAGMVFGNVSLEANIFDDIFGTHKTKHKKHRKYKKKSKKRKTSLSPEKKWQKALYFLGFYSGEINGNLTSFDTHEAIRAFEKSKGYKEDGFLNADAKEYLSFIYNISVLWEYLEYDGKSKRKNAQKIQAALKVLGLYSGKIDGLIGKNTKKRIRAYKASQSWDSTTSELNSEQKNILVSQAKSKLKQRYLSSSESDSASVSAVNPVIKSENDIIQQESTCTQPTKADNKLLVEDISGMHPDIAPKLSSMHLRRFVDAGRRFSLLVPSGWKGNGDLSEETILYLSEKNSDNAFAEYLVREVPLDKQYSNVDPKVLVMAVSKSIKETSSKRGAKLLKEPIVYRLPDMTVGYFELTRMVKDLKVWELHTVIYDGKYVYDVVLMTDDNALKTGRFLSELAVYSFWTKESCK